MFLVKKKHQPHIWSCPQFLSTSFRWAFIDIQEPHCFSHTQRRVSFLSLLKPPDALPFQSSGTHLIFSSEKGVAISWEIPELPSSTLAKCLLSFSPSLHSSSYREKVPPCLKNTKPFPAFLDCTFYPHFQEISANNYPEILPLFLDADYWIIFVGINIQALHDTFANI